MSVTCVQQSQAKFPCYIFPYNWQGDAYAHQFRLT